MEILRSGYVYVNNIYAGVIQESDDGYIFSYDKAYLNSSNPKPVSLTLPLQSEHFYSNYLFPFFDGLIPEGWLLNIVSKNWKISTADRFGLLLVCCKDPIGNVIVKGEKTI